MLTKILRKIEKNPLDRLLIKARNNGDKKILLVWNRGLGDIALGIFAIIKRIKEFIHGASITIFTREDLKEGFCFLKDIKIITTSEWKRGEDYLIPKTFKREFDLIIKKPDPTYWVKWQLGVVTPKLRWKDSWDYS